MTKFIRLALLSIIVLCPYALTNGGQYTSNNDYHYVYQSLDDSAHLTKYNALFGSSETKNDVDLSTLQCPIPLKDRVLNYTGIQCVFSSIEMLGRWAEVDALTNPPITSRSDCKSYSGPQDAARKLTRLGVKFEQVYGNRQAGIQLIKKAMAEGRGCLFNIPGHAMVLVHYDEKEDRVCWVNNSDRSLKVNTTTISGFNKMWAGWVLVVYAENDIIPFKLNPITNLPIKDGTNSSLEFPKRYIPKP